MSFCLWLFSFIFSFVCQTNRLWVETYSLGLHLCPSVLQTKVCYLAAIHCSGDLSYLIWRSW